MSLGVPPSPETAPPPSAPAPSFEPFWSWSETSNEAHATAPTQPTATSRSPLTAIDRRARPGPWSPHAVSRLSWRSRWSSAPTARRRCPQGGQSLCARRKVETPALGPRGCTDGRQKHRSKSRKQVLAEGAEAGEVVDVLVEQRDLGDRAGGTGGGAEAVGGAPVGDRQDLEVGVGG